MIAASGLKWLLTVLFAAVAGYAVWRVFAVRPAVAAAPGQSATDRIAHVLHALMSLAMAVMVWPWGMGLPAAPQVVFFSLAALWFLVVALFPGASSDGMMRRIGHAVPHAVAMGAMAWMLEAMGGGSGSGAGGSAVEMADMPGMDMSTAGSTATMTLQGPSAHVAAALAVVFLALALWWLARGFDLARTAVRFDAPGGPVTRLGRRTPTPGISAYDLSCHGAMALGMSAMLAVIA